MKVNLYSAELHKFDRGEGYNGKGAQWIAFFYPYNNYPIYFTGEDEEEVELKAQRWRSKELQKNEEREKRLANGRDHLQKKRGKLK